MNVKHNISLKEFNTFGIDAKAEHFIAVHSVNELQQVLQNAPKKIRLLGGGSNILLTDDVDGLLIKNEIKGIEIVKETARKVIVRAGGGEVWQDFVAGCLSRNLGGVENLSLIPGTVGAAPIQNIGAYGVELKDVFEKLEAINLKTHKTRNFSKKTCRFGYRDSIFKREMKGKYAITHVYFKLDKFPKTQTGYGAIQSVLKEKGIQKPSIQDVSQAVIEIRRSKLPDPAQIGNAGSFFKNPVISESEFAQLKSIAPNVVFYIQSDGVKIPAGWLIEQSGWKGKRIGNVGSYAHQALILVNHGGAKGQEVWQLAQQIQTSVFEKFGVRLQPEVNVW